MPTQSLVVEEESVFVFWRTKKELFELELSFNNDSIKRKNG